MTTYKPSLSKREIEKRKIWQEKVYRKLKSIKNKKIINLLNKKVITTPGVFAPIFPDSILLAKAVKSETKKDDTVLDMGTSCGVQAIFAAQKSSNITAVDINSKAIQCTELNIKNQKLDNVKVIKSNLFAKIKEKFDLIIFNPPFRWFKPRDMLERGELDENYKILTRFFSRVGKYLKDNGRILLVFSDSGDLKYLKSLIKRNGFKAKIIKKQKPNDWNYYIYKITRK